MAVVAMTVVAMTAVDAVDGSVKGSHVEQRLKTVADVVVAYAGSADGGEDSRSRGSARVKTFVVIDECGRFG